MIGKVAISITAQAERTGHKEGKAQILFKNLIRSNLSHMINWVLQVSLPVGSLELGKNFLIEEGVTDHAEVPWTSP